MDKTSCQAPDGDIGLGEVSQSRPILIFIVHSIKVSTFYLFIIIIYLLKFNCYVHT